MELIKIFQQLKDDMLRELMHIITNTSESWTDIQMNHELTFMLSMYSFYFSIMSCSKPSEDVDLSSPFTARLRQSARRGQADRRTGRAYLCL
jgi:hypothetical protein